MVLERRSSVFTSKQGPYRIKLSPNLRPGGCLVTRLRGHFNGQTIELDEPPPSELKPNTPVEILVEETREQVLRDFIAFLRTRRKRSTGPSQSTGRRWKGEELYERGGKPLA